MGTMVRRAPIIRPTALVVGVACVTALFGCGSASDPEPSAETVQGSPSVSPTTSGPSPTSMSSATDPGEPDEETVTEEAGATGEQDTSEEQASLELATSPDLTAPELVLRDRTFPLKLADDGVSVVDQTGEPVLVTGDAAWSLLVQLDDAGLDEYLAARREMGFDTLLVNLVEHYFAYEAPRNAFDEEPFESPGDFAHPIPEYFDRAHAMLERARDLGFTILLVPAYLGYDGAEEGWYADMVEAGPEAMYEYGQYVGERFADLTNVVWVGGGDYTPPEEGLELVEAVHDGIVEAGASQLWTAHWAPETSADDVGVSWLDFNTTYTYGPVYVASSDDDVPELSHLVIESRYEYNVSENVPQRIRAQMYESVLTGSFGSVYGHGDTWKFAPAWHDALDASGAQSMMHARALFDSVPWYSLVGDVRTNAVVPDIGEFGSESVAVAAATDDRSIVLVYVPDERDIVVDLGDVDGTVVARWFDPVVGIYIAAAADLDPDGTLAVSHPGENAGGDDDWVLDVRVG
jgi:hypothetical protein